LMIANNAVLRAGRSALYSGGADVGTIVTGNTFFDVWSETSAAIGMRVAGDGTQTSTLAIYGNYFAKGSKATTYTYATDGFAIYIDNTAHLDVQVGKNFIYGVTYALYDDGAKAAKISNGGQTTAGTGEDTLGTMTIPAATIGIGGGMRIYASGTKVGANGNKTIKFYVGATAITVFPATNDELDWQFEATIFNTATNFQKVTWNLKSTNDSSGAATVYGGYDETAIDTTADVIIKFTGECAHADDVVTQKMFYIDRI